MNKNIYIAVTLLAILLIFVVFVLNKGESGQSTYINNVYGYQISYPSDVKVMSSSDTGLSPAAENEDAVVLFVTRILEGGQEVLFPITVTDQRADNLDAAISLYKELVVPNFMIDDDTISESDFTYEKVLLGKTEALKITTPVGIVYQALNKDNIIIMLTILEEKTRNTLVNQIAQTFILTK